MKNIAVITGTRAEFGLLKPLINLILQNSDYHLQLVVTAMHLSPEFGYTIQEIENEGYTISKKIECLLSSDTAVGVTKSVGLAMISFADVIEDLNPDLVIILGDRSEMLAAATAAMFANVPIAHIHGGETTEGAYDEGIRHSITKMSSWHFASTEVYRKRIIQLGENPSRVFNVGAIGLDSIKSLNLLSKEDFEESICFSLGKKNILITYHPVTLESNSAEEQFHILLSVLGSLKETHIIFTHANSDKNGRIINKMIEGFVSKNKGKATDFKSLGQLRYLSCLQYMDIVIGNSSSGILEVPYFNIPTINIGDRQKGRVMPESVINCKPSEDEILKAINKALSHSFRDKIRNQKQLYGNGDSAAQIIKILQNLPSVDLKKVFYDF